MDYFGLQFQFFNYSNERNHDFGEYFYTMRFYVEGGLDDSPRLHLGNLGVGTAQTATPVSQHGIEFGQRVASEFYLFYGESHLFGQFFLSG